MKHKFLSLFIAIVAMTILYSPTFASVTINGIAYELNGATATVVVAASNTYPESVRFSADYICKTVNAAFSLSRVQFL